MNMFEFARKLAAFEYTLQHQAQDSEYPYYVQSPGGSLARSYLHLLGRLEALGDDEYIVAMVAEAVDVYDKCRAEAGQLHEAGRAAREAEYDEAVRRHQLAVTAECPFCGAALGEACRTAGPSGRSHSKGIHDHKDRYRAAAGLLKPEP